MTSRFRSRVMGETARKLLLPGTRGRVLAVFSMAAYLGTEQGELLWMVSEGVPMHTRGIRIAGQFPKLVVGEGFLIENECISITPHSEVDFGDASTWSASFIPDSAAPEIDQIAPLVRGFFSIGLDLAQASGFGRLIPRILALSTGEPDDEHEMDPVLALGWSAVREIAGACLLHDMHGLFLKARALIGLGEGLTPSGDDFLCGLLFSINTIQRLFPAFIDVDRFEQQLFMETAKEHTHLISLTLLKDSINGQAVEPLHELMLSVLTDKTLDSSRQHAYCLTRIGHSTGWDLLTGMLTGLLLVFPGPDLIDSSSVLLESNICAY